MRGRRWEAAAGLGPEREGAGRRKLGGAGRRKRGGAGRRKREGAGKRKRERTGRSRMDPGGARNGRRLPAGREGEEGGAGADLSASCAISLRARHVGADPSERAPPAPIPPFCLWSAASLSRVYPLSLPWAPGASPGWAKGVPGSFAEVSPVLSRTAPLAHWLASLPVFFRRACGAALPAPIPGTNRRARVPG
jgi:hypothetical protein